MAQPLILYRLWCGKKCHSRWTADLDEIDRLGRHRGIIYSNGAFGPLTWLERGERNYARSRTVPVGRGLATEEIARISAAQKTRAKSVPVPAATNT